MKNFLIFFLCAAISSTIHAEYNINGIYISDYYKLVLTKDHFQIIQSGSGHGLHATDEIISEGYYSMLESNLLEFNSDISSSAKSVASTTRIEFEYLISVCDSVEIVLDIPSDESIVVNLICIGGIDSYEVEFDYVRNKHNRIIVPRSCDIYLSIKSNRGTIPNWIPSLCFQGIQEVFIPISHIEKNCSTIQISVPGIKGNYFERMFLKGEYALILGDTIRFKGVEFVKAHE